MRGTFLTFCLLASSLWAQSGLPVLGSSQAPASGGGSTVVFNNTNAMGQATGTSFSGAMSVTAGGSNIVAFAPVAFDGATSGLSVAVTYNGVSMVSCGAAFVNPVSNTWIQVFYYINPPTGSHTLAVTGTGAGFAEIYVNLVSFTGVNQTTPVRPGTFQNASTTGVVTTISQAITSDTHDLTFAAVEAGNGGGVTSTNQTLDGSSSAGANGAASDHATTAAASVTDSWVFSSGDNVWVGFSIQHA